MKKIIYLAFCAACMLTFGACSKSKDATLTPQSANVQGDLRDYFTVVERPYVVKYDENGWNKYLISIELQRTDKDFAFDTEGIEPVGYFGQGINGNFGIGIEVYDATSNLVLSKAASTDGLSGVYSSDDLKNLLSLAEGETGFVRWSADEFENCDPREFTFKITSYLKIDKQTKKSKSSLSSFSDVYDEVNDLYNEAMKEASDMYDEALKEAEEMYEDAYEQALEAFDVW